MSSCWGGAPIDAKWLMAFDARRGRAALARRIPTSAHIGASRREPFRTAGASHTTMGVLVSHSIILRASETVSDADLVSRAAGGDRWSREMIYRRHAGLLLAIAARLLGNRGDAEEVVQDTFVTAFEQLRALRDPGALRAWLAQITVSLVRRRIRRGRLMRVLGLDRGADDATLAALAAPGTAPDERADLAMVD